MRKQEADIFKIQRPIISNEGNMVLCYNENRSVNGRFPMTKELEKLFGEGEYKIYVVGYLDKDKLQIVRKCTKDFEGF